MIKLGCYDAGVDDSACQAYLKQVADITRIPSFADIQAGLDKITMSKYVPDSPQSMSVADVQRGLQAIGFFPAGKVDGICGYRMQSAMRLFQEYVRTVENVTEMIPDGRFGPQSQAHLRRWMDGNLQSVWAQTMESWQSGTMGQTEYTDWLALLENVKQSYLQNPNAMLDKVNAYTGDSGTRKVADWDFSQRSTAHLIGIRRDEFRGKSDDIFVLLLKGLVFKFQGSTEPGATEDPRGYPFLVQGQHDYHFGWHRQTYLALRPLTTVLVVRSKVDQLDDADLNNGLEPNASINIHWGGRGMSGELKNWSEGCQVISGTVYINPQNQLINCSAFAAVGSKEPLTNPVKTRGAYNVLLDLVSALSVDQGTMMKYTLLVESDLDQAPALKQQLADARNTVMALL